MMGIYRDDSKGRGNRKPWVADVTVAHPDGRELRRKKRANTQKEAKEEEKALEAQLRKELYRPEEVAAEKISPTISELYKDFLVSYGSNHKPSSTNRLRTTIDREVIPRFGTRKVNTIEKKDFLALKLALMGRGLTNPATINGTLGALGSLMSFALDMNYIKQKPHSCFEKVPPPEDLRTISEDDYAKLLEASSQSPGLYALVRVAVEGGLRIGELLALRWADVREDYLLVRRSDWRGVVTDTKNHKAREVQLTPQTLEALKQITRKEGEVFCRPDGRAYSYDVLARRLHGLCRLVGLESFGWHLLRHTSFTRMGRGGVPLQTIANLAGHSDMKITQRYLHPGRKDREDAARIIGAISPATHTTPSDPQAKQIGRTFMRGSQIVEGQKIPKISIGALNRLRVSRLYALSPCQHKEPSSLFVLSRGFSSRLIASIRTPQAPPGIYTGEALAYSFLELAELQELTGGES